MSEERLQEIKDSVDFQYTLAKAKCIDNALLFADEEKELIEEIERLNNIIKEAQEYLRSATHLLLEYNKPFRKVGKYEEQYCKRESDLKRILKGEKVEWGIILDKGE